MRAIKIMSVLIAACLLSACLDGVNDSLNVAPGQKHSEDFSTVNGNVRLAKNAVLEGDVKLVNGSIDLEDGAKAENIETVNGSVDIGDEVHVDDVVTVNGRVRVGENAEIESITTVNGSIKIKTGSAVEKNIVAVNGLISLYAVNVGGDVSKFNGGMYLTDGTIVDGDLKVEENKGINIEMGEQTVPVIVVGPKVTIKGNLDFEREVDLYVHTSAKVGSINGAEAQQYSDAEPPKMPN